MSPLITITLINELSMSYYFVTMKAKLGSLYSEGLTNIYDLWSYQVIGFIIY